MPDPKKSLAQYGYEAYAAAMQEAGLPHASWHALLPSQRDAWAEASDAIIEGWEDLHDDPLPTRRTP
jgi:hypothetical protein